MKLSINWIFDHIQGSLKNYDIQDLIKRLSATTAEIEAVKKITIDLDTLTLARVTKQAGDSVTLESGEWKKEFVLEGGSRLVKDAVYLIKKEQKQYRLATMVDLGAEKEGVLPALACSDEEFKGSWKQSVETEDYTVTLDNKAVTHRPDLWGHRGFARELAAILGLSLKPEEYFLAAKPIKHFGLRAPESSTNPYTIEIADTRVCKRLAALHISSCNYKPSLMQTVFRLARIDARAIDAIVDATNYVMYDFGQPMHAFDAHKIEGNKLVAQAARDGEKLVLLDGEEITLTAADCIIGDGNKALALAGIMGGAQSGVSAHTKSLLLESANFDATAIRLTAARYKKRTEASARFEKSLDPNQNTQVLLRFLKLLDDAQITYSASSSIISLGDLAQEKAITVTNDFIVKRLGSPVAADMVVKILTALGFGVRAFPGISDTQFDITVPTYRSTKDVSIKEDIVEEVGRFVGYAHIVPQLPTRQMAPLDHSRIRVTRAIKNHCAFALGMRELYTYAFFDEDFIRRVEFDPQNTVTIKNPVSENWKRLVTSLVPHLLKNVEINITKQDRLRFFEVGRVWSLHNKTEITERGALAYIDCAYKSTIDFYDAKAQLQTLFDLLHVPVLWRKPQTPVAPWYDEHQTGELLVDNIVIGYAGKLSPVFLANVCEGECFAVELDMEFLLSYTSAERMFMPLPKYQTVSLDISMIVPHAVTVDSLESTIVQADARVCDIALVDFFEKPEWGDRRSVTLRFVLVDEHKTMTKEEIDDVWNSVVQSVKTLGAEIR